MMKGEVNQTAALSLLDWAMVAATIKDIIAAARRLVSRATPLEIEGFG